MPPGACMSDREIPITATRHTLIENSTLTIQQKWFLEVINTHQGNNPSAFMLQQTLTEACSYKHTRQIRKLIKPLTEMGVLIVSGPTGSRRCDNYSIDVQELAALRRTQKTTQTRTEPALEGQPDRPSGAAEQVNATS